MRLCPAWHLTAINAIIKDNLYITGYVIYIIEFVLRCNMKLSRLIGILLIIESKVHIRAKELSELFEVSVRTIYRDVDLLCEAGIPIFATSGPNGGFSFVEGYILNAKALDINEMEKLIFSLHGQMLKTSREESADNLLLKLKKVIPKREQENFERLFNKTKIDAHSWWGAENRALQAETNLEIIQKSIYKLKKITFDYRSNTEFTTQRVLQPYGIVHKENAWYVVGYSEERKQLRTFHCDRMRNVIISEEAYTIPSDFNLELYWDRSTREFIRKTSINNKKETSSNLNSNIKYPVLLECNMDVSELFFGFNVLKKEAIGPNYTYDVDLISERTALNLLFSHLGDIKIIKPLELRKKIIEIANKILKRQNN